MIPIFKPFMPEGIDRELNNILYSGKLAYGSYGRKFEERLSKYIGNNKLLTVTTYNHALLVVLSTLGLKPGDEVIASPVSCLASNQPLAIKGLKIKWADINPNTGSICLEDVRSKITSKTKVILHNHYCGYLGDIDEINSLAREYGIIVIDDCIEAFGASYKGNKAGNFETDITIFSFQTVRLPNTINGGAIVFKDNKLFEKAKLVRDYGINRRVFRDDMNEINPRCDIKLEGYGALMSEINSFIGLKQMEKLDSLLSVQKQNAKIWDKIIEHEKDIKALQINKNSKPNYWVYGVLSTNKLETIKSFRNKGFYATSVHINNNIYSIFKNHIELKGVNDFMSSFIALPCGWWINQKDLDGI